jgi:uncharacterized membrane protein
MPSKKILLVGESWVTSETHYKGFDQFGSVHFHLGAKPLVAALKAKGIEVDYMPAHEAAEAFPFEKSGLDPYSVVILSDIGANTLLLPPSVWIHGKPVPNRLKMLREWVSEGGGLFMAGGYFSFQGIDGKARWRSTPVEDALPVTCLPYDDRLEVPEGFRPVLTKGQSHPIFHGLKGEWPILLGANEVVAKADDSVEVLATLPEGDGGHPLLVTGQYGKGRTVVWTSDIGPHWLPTPFVEWSGYGVLFANILRWAAREI